MSSWLSFDSLSLLSYPLFCLACLLLPCPLGLSGLSFFLRTVRSTDFFPQKINSSMRSRLVCVTLAEQLEDGSLFV